MKRLARYLTLLRIFFHGGGYRRADYLKRKHYFKKQGDHCYFQPWNFGTEPHMISFGDNVHVASGVTFINHDITAFMFRYMERDETICVRRGPISIGDNVFIGSNSMLLYDVKIGNNVIVGAGSLVNKDVPDGVIVGGVPARIIGEFDEYKDKILQLKQQKEKEI